MVPISAARSEPKPITGRFVFLCVFAFFVAIAATNAVMIRFAVTTFGGVETESSYKAGLDYARDTAAARAQDARGWLVDVRTRVSGSSREIEISARDKTDAPLSDIDAAATLMHPTNRKRDIDLPVVLASPGRFVALINRLSGQWDLAITLSQNGERLFHSKSRIVLPPSTP